MVAACSIGPNGEKIYGVNYADDKGTRVHAERAAIDKSQAIGPEWIIVTTLSPCNRPMDERSGESCEDLIKELGITHVYCGYKDPTQKHDSSVETNNTKLRKLCKKIADTFLKENLKELANTSLDVKEPRDFVNVNDRKQTTWKVFKFKSGKNTFLVNFTVQKSPTSGKMKNWNAVNVAFGIKEKQDDYSFGDEINTDLTARNKNQFLIYSTVINTIRKFITELNTEIDEIIVQGAGERQESMYQRFFQVAPKYFPGWHHNGKHSLVRDVPRQPVKKNVAEASYLGNIGMMEVAKFFNIATPEEKTIFKQLMSMGEKSKAWQLIQQVTGVKLHGKEFEPVTEDQDYMAGHCHVMAIALKMLHPDWQIRAHVGWEDEEAEDDEYRVDHVYIVAPDGTAYDCRGQFPDEESLVGEDVTGGFETQYADFDLADIQQLVQRGELKRFTREDINKAMAFAKRIQQ
jgi:pyrimidine deaminase RibD-like protein